MNIQSIVLRIHSFLKSSNISVLIWVPFLAGFVVLGMFLIIWPNGFSGTHTQGLWVSLGWFCFGLSGIPKLIRQESFFGPFHYKGRLAVIDGILTVVLFWALASIPILGWNR